MIFVQANIVMANLSVLVGERIRLRRKRLKINQEKLALIADIDRSYMGRIERGEVNITLDKLYGLCAVLQCEAAELLPLRSELDENRYGVYEQDKLS